KDIEETISGHEKKKASGDKKDAANTEKLENEFVRTGLNLAAAFATEAVKKGFGGEKWEKYRKPIALDRILHLRREMDKVRGEPPKSVPGLPNGSEKDRDMGYVQYVHEIFEQHQRDM